MSDIVERLRERPSRHAAETEDQAKERRQREREEAADTITTLRATNERLRGALERHVCDCKSNCAWERDETCPSWDALAALAQEKHND
jgi:hypothetical protein